MPIRRGWAGLLLSVPLLTGCVSAPAEAPHPPADPSPAPPGAAQPPPADAPEQPGEHDPRAIPADCTVETEQPKRQLRGAWLTTVRNLDWPSESGLSAEQQQEELRDYLDTAEQYGLNTVFLHVRPTADAMYSSDLEPWARYLTGEQGGDPGYDPLAVAIEEAHERGIELHAWFNPYRVGHAEDDLDDLAEEHPVEENPEWMIEHEDQGYFDPGNPEVQQWVSDVVLDVVERYDIDGVHFDDYFYPYPGDGEDFEDDDTWEEHGEDFEDRAAWRRDNINTLIADVHERIHDTKPWVQFGISPFGVWRNADSDSSGSDTQALQSYDDQHADTRTWIEEGWIDNVIPQLYWERGRDGADYEELVPWWSEEVEGTDVDFYVGQAAFRVGEDQWDSADALSRQLDFNTDYDEVHGDVYYALSSFTDEAEEAAEDLAAGHYAQPALTPQDSDAEGHPDPVDELEATAVDDSDPEAGVEMEWTVPEEAHMFAVYRVDSDVAAGIDEGDQESLCALSDPDNLVDVVGAGSESQRLYQDTQADADEEDHYLVTSLDVYRSESAPSPSATQND